MVGRALWNIGAGVLSRAFIKDKQALNGIGFIKPHIWKARTGFLDIDINLHLNNSSYLYNMELARWHMTGVMGLLGLAVKQKWMFLVASQTIRYRRSIAPFAPYEIHTKMVYWDDNWMYISHQFVCPKTGALYADALTRGIIKKGKKTISLQEAADALGTTVPEITDEPAIVKGFLEWDTASKGISGNWDQQAHATLDKSVPFWKQTINSPPFTK
ncbi:hypothetical protein THRCLA_06589 [Thraustotheca clavata]|uniref:Thioesterase n=1 Tax=Thraustotheca clavata TaxID=74557 RepID=A0A1V9ZMH8_9STRA|nr:hypothetical protein THRCLA_06589 [Thraustotheca clavata]